MLIARSPAAPELRSLLRTGHVKGHRARIRSVRIDSNCVSAGIRDCESRRIKAAGTVDMKTLRTAVRLHDLDVHPSRRIVGEMHRELLTADGLQRVARVLACGSSDSYWSAVRGNGPGKVSRRGQQTQRDAAGEVEARSNENRLRAGGRQVANNKSFRCEQIVAD